MTMYDEREQRIVPVTIQLCLYLFKLCNQKFNWVMIEI